MAMTTMASRNKCDVCEDALDKGVCWRTDECQRVWTARMNRAANRPMPRRVIEPVDRDTEIMERTGFTYYRDDRAIDWSALTKAQ